MIRVETVDDLKTKYPDIPREIISEIYLCGFDCYKAKIGDVVIDLFMNLGEKDSIYYKEKISKIYIDSNIVIEQVRS